MDLHTGGYRTYDDLLGYMELGGGDRDHDGPDPGVGRPAAAREHARQLGLAFQLTFIRDVAEDHRRGRVYLPAADLERFGVRRADLAAPASPRQWPSCWPSRSPGPGPLRGRRAGHRAARPLLPPCVRVAFELYGGILDEVERAGYQVLGRRVAVPATAAWRRRPPLGRRPHRRPRRTPRQRHHPRRPMILRVAVALAVMVAGGSG